MAHVPRKRQLCDSRIVKRIAAFPSILIAMILAAPCRNHPGLLSAAERPNSQQQTERQQSQPESKPASAAYFRRCRSGAYRRRRAGPRCDGALHEY